MKHLVVLFLCLAGLAHASSVTLQVEQSQKLDTKGKTDETKTQTRQLTITVANISPSQPTDVEVRYWFFGKKVDASAENVIKSGQRKLSLEASGKQTFLSDTVSTTYTEDHFNVEKRSKGKGAGGGGKNKNKAPVVKKVEGEGTRITGYGVQVVEGGHVAASFYSSPSIKERLESRSR